MTGGRGTRPPPWFAALIVAALLAAVLLLVALFDPDVPHLATPPTSVGRD
ncbi:hypothetical protein [Sphingomonas baiyangensis]|nr:hypothetical protein [Sphingomonas baiyangensis]